MSRTVTALYSTREEAERAAAALRAQVSLAHAEVYDCSPAAAASLDRLELTPEERAACETRMTGGEYMLLAQVRGGEDPDRIVEALERIAEQDARAAQFGETGAAPAVSEHRLPVVEEELRVGTREVVRGGARVRTHIEEVPVREQIELIEERLSVERRPATRLISEAELAQSDLMRDRVIEVAQVREEAVVTKEAFVREEVLVKKSVERRVEQINETVRRTEVETEELRPDEAAAALAHAGEERPGSGG